MEDSDLGFLSMLNNEVHLKLESRITREKVFDLFYDINRKINHEEISRIIELLKRRPDFVICPIKVEYLSKIGFSITHDIKCDGVKMKIPVLSFLEEQLPEGYDFYRLLGELKKDYKREDYAPKEHEMDWW